MPAPVWTTGQVLAAADVNNWFTPDSAIKAADQFVTNSTVLVPDTALFLPVAASASYEWWLELFVLPVNNSATPGLSMSMTGPAGCTISYIVREAVKVTGIGGSGTTVTGLGSPASGSFAPIRIHGCCLVAGTPGILQFNWAQNVSSATQTVVKSTSFMTQRRIA